MGYFDDYTPSDLEDQFFLATVPLDILKQSIKAQFDNPLELRKNDNVQTFIDSVEYSKLATDDEDDIIELEQNRVNFITFMCRMFEVYFNVEFPTIDDMGDDDQHELIHLTYRFFIRNIRKNISNVVLNYCYNNREEILENYQIKKTVSALSFKKELNDELDVTILSNLSEIITDILQKDLDVDDFFDLCVSDEPILETEFVRDKYESFDITGNFVEKYFSMIDSSFMNEIESKVRSKILKKYKKLKD